MHSIRHAVPAISDPVTKPLPEQAAHSRSFALNGLFFLASLVVLKLAKPLLVPFVLALFFYFLLAPLILLLGKYRIPRALAAAMVITLLSGALGLAVLKFAEPAVTWIEEIPNLAPSIKEKLEPVSEPIASIEAAASQVENLAAPAAQQQREAVTLAEQSVTDGILASIPYLLVSLGIVVFLTFFFLIYGERLQRHIARLGRNFCEQRRLVGIGRDIQSEISRFLIAVTVINLCLGAVASFLFWMLDVPNYFLWGGMVAVANFVPYAGPTVMIVVMAAVGLISFETLTDAALVPLSLLLLVTLEGQLITPILIGRRLDLSPVVVFVAVIFWGYIWGLAGALVAVPLVVSTKIVFSHIPALRPVAALLGR